jgi:hypothetical protein
MAEGAPAHQFASTLDRLGTPARAGATSGKFDPSGSQMVFGAFAPSDLQKEQRHGGWMP